MSKEALLKAIAVTVELCGRAVSPGAAEVFCDDLAPYPPDQVMASLQRCRREVRGILTVEDVVRRLDDGRPGPEEAWAGLPLRESDTAVWTSEMAQAFGVATPLIEAGEIVAARMAFKEAYTRLVAKSRERARPVEWQATLGHDPRGRETMLLQAVQQGKLTLDEARNYCPALSAPSAEVLKAIGLQ